MDKPDTPAELKARALRYLVRREHSCDELRRKLARHAESPQTLQGVLDFLVSRRLLSDERFAEVRAHRLARKYGAAKIRQDLKTRGVSDEVCARVACEENELQKAKTILERKYRAPAVTREERAKRARFLHGRGFSYDTIRCALSGSTNFSEE